MHMRLKQICKDRNISPDIFKWDPAQQQASIAEHAAWAYQHIYRHGYPNHTPIEGINRFHHGIQHTSRAAYYLPVFVNLYALCDLLPPSAISNDDMQILMIGLFFHDSARLNEERDLWDKESAILFYCYLTCVLGISAEKARSFAEAVANKDQEDACYYELIETGDGEFDWKKNDTIKEKNLKQVFTHECDCLDILRARDSFNGKYLDFYKKMREKFIETNHKHFAFSLLAHLICEARSLIHKQGDGRFNNKPEIKLQYENENAFNKIKEDAKSYYLLDRLFNDGQLLNEQQLVAIKDEFEKHFTVAFDSTNKQITADHVMNAMLTGNLYLRAVGSPSANLAEKNGRTETVVEKEIYKFSRNPNVPTRANTERKKLGKTGNPNRSINLQTNGTVPYGACGFGMINLSLEKCKKISAVDCDSGYKKKQYYRAAAYLSIDDATQQKETLFNQMQLGGSANANKTHTFVHNEIIYDLELDDIKFVYFTNDPVSFERNYPLPPYHAFSAELQAISIALAYEKSYPGKSLPLVEISGIHQVVKIIEYTDRMDEAMQKWKQAISDLIKKLRDHDLFEYSVDDIKIAAIYGRGFQLNTKVARYAFMQPDDRYFPDAFKASLNEFIAFEKQKKLNLCWETCKEKLRTGDITVADKCIMLYIRHYPHLAFEIKDDINQALSKQNDNLLKNNIVKELNKIELAKGNAFQYLLLAKNIKNKHFVDSFKKIAIEIVKNHMQSILNQPTAFDHIETMRNFIMLINFTDMWHHSVEQSGKPIAASFLALFKDHLARSGVFKDRLGNEEVNISIYHRAKNYITIVKDPDLFEQLQTFIFTTLENNKEKIRDDVEYRDNIRTYFNPAERFKTSFDEERQTFVNNHCLTEEEIIINNMRDDDYIAHAKAKWHMTDSLTMDEHEEALIKLSNMLTLWEFESQSPFDILIGGKHYPRGIASLKSMLDGFLKAHCQTNTPLNMQDLELLYDAMIKIIQKTTTIQSPSFFGSPTTDADAATRRENLELLYNKISTKIDVLNRLLTETKQTRLRI